MARILIMDDDASVRLALRKLLEKMGHAVEEAPNAVEGAKLYNESVPDLIITDLLMPERDGVEALIDLHARHPNIKTIVISGEAPEFLPIAEDLGAHYTIAKPFKNQDIIDTVTRLLSDKSSGVDATDT